MTLEKAHKLLADHAGFGGSYNRNAVKLILAEVGREHGQEAVDRLILELRLDEIFGIARGSSFESAWGSHSPPESPPGRR
jgi:hypothetical protein